LGSLLKQDLLKQIADGVDIGIRDGGKRWQEPNTGRIRTSGKCDDPHLKQG
jgi:hypothetical protein